MRPCAPAPGGGACCARAPQPGDAPWSITFDLRERETLWTDENKARLVAIVAAEELRIPAEELDQALHSLMLLLPDLGACE